MSKVICHLKCFSLSISASWKRQIGMKLTYVAEFKMREAYQQLFNWRYVYNFSIFNLVPDKPILAAQKFQIKFPFPDNVQKLITQKQIEVKTKHTVIYSSKISTYDLLNKLSSLMRHEPFQLTKFQSSRSVVQPFKPYTLNPNRKKKLNKSMKSAKIECKYRRGDADAVPTRVRA